MKRYVIAILMIQNVCAMELIPLSSQDDAKALRFAKLFNKYPYGYGENKQCIDATREKINWFLNKIEPLNAWVEPLFYRYPSESGENKSRIDVDREKRNCFFKQFEFLSSRVKQYQGILNNMEALELLDCMHETLPCDIKSKIFTAALCDDAQQYYAISNALKFVILEPYLAFAGYYSGVINVCSPCFLAELYEDGRSTICFSDDGVKCELYCVDRSIVKAYSHPSYTGSTLRLRRPDQKAFTSELIAFVSQDSKKARIDAFKKLFASWVEYLANETDKEKYMSAFVKLLSRLNWHDITLWDAKDCEKILKRESILHNIESW